MPTGPNILVTGPPRCGKTILIEKLVRQIKRPMTGFITREIRDLGRRVGFSYQTMDGKRGILAHRDIPGRPRVGKYGVNIEEFERDAVGSLRPNAPDQIVILDEIGKMECFSALFKSTVLELLESNHDVLGSISEKGDRFILGIKQRPDVTLVQVSERNRNSLTSLAGQF